jgi:Cys-tRNA synthase (O-phospho-L-seryl-tRNA:Cys-tRNA synthase)
VTGRRVNKDIRGLQVFVDQRSLVQLAERAREADGEVQKPRHFHRSLNESMERLTTGIIQHKHRLVVVLGQITGPNCPSCVEFVP